MSTPTKLIAELAKLPKFFEEQKQCNLDSDAMSELMRAQATCISAKIKSLIECDLRSATELTKAVHGVGWDKETTAKLATLVNEMKNQLEDGNPNARRPNQKCSSFNMYLTDIEYTTLADSMTPWSAKFAVVKKRCFFIGLLLPSEKTKGHILECIYVANGLPLEKGKDWFAHLNNIKEALAPLGTVKYPFEFMTEFPLSPKDLPSETYKHAYETDPPSMKEYRELTFGTSQLALNKKSPPMLNLRAPSATDPNQFMAEACRQIGAQMLLQGMMKGLPSTSAGMDPYNMLHAGQFPMAPPAVDERAGACADDSDASEESAAGRLRTKATGKGKAAGRMPRPAASAAAAKRPASAAPSSGDADPPPMKKAKEAKKGGVTESDLPKGSKLNLKEFLSKRVAAKYPSKGACTSKLYTEGGKQARDEKLSSDDVKLAQKVAYGIGSSFWVNSGL
ncbi:unnamed protein product [Prorocentrum cordatum]|uniref:Uncharacterized protein n=1 Tax=Prorocentrum cordatum TaxID=2364126 RepID=A0ABN9U582_9DINO|nr:unnamed protein product [Polarella glacialis]